MRRIAAATAEPTRDSVLCDLEAVKYLAFDEANLTAAVRVIELQGRTIGALGEPDPDLVRRAPDDVLIEAIAGDNKLLADMLRESLATGKPPPAPPDGAVR